MNIEPITLVEANAILTQSGRACGHYLGRIHNCDYALATSERDAVAVFRAPTASAWTKALKRPLELSRLYRLPSFSGEPITDHKGRTWPARQLSEFVAASLRWIKSEAPEVEIVLAYSDESVKNSAIPVREHDGTIYRALNFKFLGYSTPMPHWEDLAGNRISTKMARTLHGTRSMEKIAKLEPSWELVPARPKLLWAYPMAMSVEDALALYDARAGSGRAIYKSVQPPPFRVWD